MSAQPKNRSNVRIGFIALTDAAPIVVAKEKGFFEGHGVNATLSREVGWATIRDKVVYGELDAAHALAGMLVSTRLGIDSKASKVVSGCLLSLHGNAITLGRHFIDAGVSDAAALKAEIDRRAATGRPKVVLGVVYTFSSHNVQLHLWLEGAGIDPDRDVRIVVVPPAQMFRNLVARTIDGFCVGEPWNSVAVANRAGGIVSRSCDEHPGHVEKVLMVREDFALREMIRHEAMINAIVEAGVWCDDPQNHAELAEILSAPHYLGQDAAIIGRALEETTGPMLVFSRQLTNRPARSRAESVVRGLQKAGLVALGANEFTDLTTRMFREDLFLHATQTNATHENARL